MIIGIISFIIFLFCVYQLTKDDFIFLRKNITTEDVFNIIFITLPVALLSARIGFVLLHPKWNYLNPLIFFIVPYFPGLSLLAGIVGSWIFISIYTRNKKILTKRLFDILAISFFFAYTSALLMQAGVTVFSNRLSAISDAGMGLLAVLISIFLLSQFLRNKMHEGGILFSMFLAYCLLSGISDFFIYMQHKPVSFISLGLTGVFFLISLVLFIRQEKVVRRVLGK